MSFLKGLRRHLLGASRPNYRETKTVDVSQWRGRERIVECVGEAAYQRQLGRIAGPKTEKGVNAHQFGQLVPDPANQHDHNPVAVVVAGNIVGYLDRGQALGYHEALRRAGHPGSAVVGFRTRIHGGWKRPDSEGHYSISLYLPEALAKQTGFGQSR